MHLECEILINYKISKMCEEKLPQERVADKHKGEESGPSDREEKFSAQITVEEKQVPMMLESSGGHASTYKRQKRLDMRWSYEIRKT